MATKAKTRKTKQERPHWLAQAGLRGCMPTINDVYTTKTAAVESLAENLEFGERRKRDLARTYILDLDVHEHGVEYCSVEPCYCPEPGEHSESDGWEEY